MKNKQRLCFHNRFKLGEGFGLYKGETIEHN